VSQEERQRLFAVEHEDVVEEIDQVELPLLLERPRDRPAQDEGRPGILRLQLCVHGPYRADVLIRSGKCEDPSRADGA